jgi:hypothetical protein
MTPIKIDLFKLHKNDYVSPKKPVLVNLKSANYLAIEGQGEPGGEVFASKVGALYAVAFTLKMTQKFAGLQDYAVCKLEAQWWAPDGSPDFASVSKNKWCWKLLIRTPDFIGASELASAVEKLMDKGKEVMVKNVKIESLAEGDCVQMLHVGPYDKECESVQLMASFVKAKGCVIQGKHHEIYLSDPRRVPAAQLKTILRLPLGKVTNS